MFAWNSSSIPLPLKAISCINMNQNIYCGLENGKVIVCNPNNEIQELVGHVDKITAIACYDDYLSTGDSSGLIIIWKFHKNAFYEEMSNNKTSSPITSLKYSDSLLAISYLNGHLIVGSGSGQLVWHCRLDSQIVDTCWWNEQLLVLTDSPCEIHFYSNSGTLSAVKSINIQQPLKFAVNPLVKIPNQQELLFVFKTKKSLVGMFELESNKLVDFKEANDFIFFNNHLLLVQSNFLCIYSINGKFINKVKSNEVLLFVSAYNDSLISACVKCISFYKHRSLYQVEYNNNYLFYIKNISSSNRLCIYTPSGNFFKSLNIPNLCLFATSATLICFTTSTGTSSTVNICNYQGLLIESFSVPFKIISITFDDSFLGFVSNHFYYIYKSFFCNSEPTISYLNKQSIIHCPVDQFQQQMSHSHDFIKCTKHNHLFYILTENSQLLIINPSLELLTTIELPIGPITTLSSFIINKNQIAIISHFQLFLLSYNQSSATSIAIRQNVLDVLFHNDPHVCCLEKQKLTILNSESVVIDGNILCYFHNYHIMYVDYHALPIKPTKSNVFQIYKCEQLIICKSIDSVPNDHFVLYELLAIDLLKQGNVSAALQATKHSRNISLLLFIKGLNGVDMAEIYEFLGDLDSCIAVHSKNKSFNKIAALLYKNNKFLYLLDYLEYLTKQQEEAVYKHLADYYYSIGDYKAALQYVKDPSMRIKCALYSRDEATLLEVQAPINNIEWPSSNFKQTDGILDGLLKNCPLRSKKRLLFVSAMLSKDFNKLKLQHYFQLAVKNCKNQKYLESMMCTLPLLIHQYELDSVLLVRGISAYYCKEYNASAACFGRYRMRNKLANLEINSMFLQFNKMALNAQDGLICINCRHTSLIQKSCTKCKEKVEFDDDGIISKNKKRCKQCDNMINGDMCKICHYLNVGEIN
eukprot:NODE_195_length_15388_cov_0.563926.p3 type:complete len:923 gc:universal NODE_195_length_15388_cov_0.563926:11775-14543(+)